MTTSSDRFLQDLRSEFEGWSVGPSLRLHAQVDPSPQHRPRVGKFGTYYPKGYQTYHAECQRQFSLDRGVVGEGRLGVIVSVAVRRPKATKLALPRGDADNYAKAPLDAATRAGVWKDDSQIECLAVLKRWTVPGEDAGVTMWVYSMKED